VSDTSINAMNSCHKCVTLVSTQDCCDMSQVTKYCLTVVLTPDAAVSCDNGLTLAADLTL